MTTHILEFVYGSISVAEIPEHPEVRKLFDDHGNTVDLAIGDRIMFCPNSVNQKWLTAGYVTGFDSCGDPNRIETDESLSTSVRGCGYIAKMPHK